jgi:hypothetical protein
MKIKNLIAKSLWCIIDLYKALPPGTKRQRKGGIYEKQSNGKWVKVKEKKEEKPLQTPRELKTMSPKQNRQFINQLKGKFSEKQLDKRKGLILSQIRSREKELESQGIDFRKKPDHGLNNLWHNHKLTETAIEEIRDKNIK